MRMSKTGKQIQGGSSQQFSPTCPFSVYTSFIPFLVFLSHFLAEQRRQERDATNQTEYFLVKVVILKQHQLKQNTIKEQCSSNLKTKVQENLIPYILCVDILPAPSNLCFSLLLLKIEVGSGSAVQLPVLCFRVAKKS